MKPSPLHYLLAQTWLISGFVGALGGVGLLLAILVDGDALIADKGVVLWGALAAIPMAALGWVMGVFVLWRFAGPLAARFQGWPFQLGDEVCILSGEHANTTALIYEIWEERGEVRLELGELAKAQVEDVISIVAVCRTKKKNKTQHQKSARAGASVID